MVGSQVWSVVAVTTKDHLVPFLIFVAPALGADSGRSFVGLVATFAHPSHFESRWWV